MYKQECVCMAKKKIDIKTTVILTEGYEKRYTEACLRALAARDKKGILNPPPGLTGSTIIKS